jgi:hypothetical protein
MLTETHDAPLSTIQTHARLSIDDFRKSMPATMIEAYARLPLDDVEKTALPTMTKAQAELFMDVFWTGPVLNLDQWPPEREGYTLLAEAAHQICEGIADFQVYTPMPRGMARRVLRKISNGVLSGRLKIGRFQGEVFTPLSLRRWRRAYWLELHWDQANHPSGLFAELYIEDERLPGGYAPVSRRISF